MAIVTMPNPGGGLLGGLADGLKQGMITYQTVQGIQHQQQLQNLAAGVQDDGSGNLAPTAAHQQQMDITSAENKRHLGLLDASSPESQHARDLYGGILKSGNPGADTSYLDNASGEDLHSMDKIIAPTNVQYLKNVGAEKTAGMKADSAENVANIGADKGATVANINAGAKIQGANIGAGAKNHATDVGNTTKQQAIAAGVTKAGDKNFLAFQNDLDPNKARGGNLAASQKVVNASQRLDALFKQFPDGNIPEAQTTELATGAAALISGGSPQSQQQINHIVPQSAIGNMESLKAWFDNEPMGKNQQAFIQLLKESVGREGALAQKQVHDAQAQRIPGYQNLYNQDPAKYKGMLKARGFQDSEIGPNGEYVPAGQAPAGGGLLQGAPATDPAAAAKIQRLQELKAKMAGQQ